MPINWSKSDKANRNPPEQMETVQIELPVRKSKHVGNTVEYWIWHDGIH